MATETERAAWGEDNLAYDGWSCEPQSRELTPRERDILCRIIGGFKHKLQQFDGKGALDQEFIVKSETLNEPEFDWMRCSISELQTILDLYEVLTPRRDEDGNPE